MDVNGNYKKEIIFLKKFYSNPKKNEIEKFQLFDFTR